MASRADREWSSGVLAKHGETLIAVLREGTPLGVALRIIGADASRESVLADRPEVIAAVATFEAELHRRLRDGDSDQHRNALAVLERRFHFRKPASKTIADEFGEILAEFARLEPEAYRTLHRLISRNDKSASEKRRRHSAGEAEG